MGRNDGPPAEVKSLVGTTYVFIRRKNVHLGTGSSLLFQIVECYRIGLWEIALFFFFIISLCNQFKY